jgi:insertion element IS1 protein InsB
MRLKARGGRDTARVWRIRTDTVRRELRPKDAALTSGQTTRRRAGEPAELIVAMEPAGEAEVDERWRCVGQQGNQRWLWHAIDHHTGQVVASVFGRRTDEGFLQLKALREPFGLTQFYTDHWGAYERHRDPDRQSPGKTEHPENRAQASDVTNAAQTLGP